MPPIREDVTTKDQMLADNVQGVINYQLDVEGRRKQQIIARLQERYPNATRRSIEAAYNHTIDARSAARSQNRAGEQGRANPSIIPRNPNNISKYRYVVRVLFIDPNTGVAHYHTTVVDSVNALTNSELRDRAYEQTKVDRSDRNRRGEKYEGRLPGKEDIVITVTILERR